MPQAEISFTDQKLAELEKIRQQQGLNNIDQVTEYLLKRRLRRAAQKVTGRGRALHLAGKGVR